MKDHNSIRGGNFMGNYRAALSKVQFVASVSLTLENEAIILFIIIIVLSFLLVRMIDVLSKGDFLPDQPAGPSRRFLPTSYKELFIVVNWDF